MFNDVVGFGQALHWTIGKVFTKIKDEVAKHGIEVVKDADGKEKEIKLNFLKIKDIRDLTSLADLSERILKLQNLMTGEPTEINEIIVRLPEDIKESDLI